MRSSQAVWQSSRRWTSTKVTKDTNFPSILNDVYGPVMRGPSSSHSAAALRIGRMARDLMGGSVNKVLMEFDPNGSLVTTHESQGSDMGLFGGLLGWEPDDPRLPSYQREAESNGLKTEVKYISYNAKHPNNYRLTLGGKSGTRHMQAISTGGGMIQVTEIEGAPVSMKGDFYETLVFLDSASSREANHETLVQQFVPQFEDYALIGGGQSPFLQIKSRSMPSLSEEARSHNFSILKPVLPILSRKNLEVPFMTCDEMLAFNADKGWSFPQLALHYESVRGGITPNEVMAKMTNIKRIIETCIANGLKGTKYDDRILPCQSTNFKRQMERSKLVGLPGEVMNNIIMYVSAIMEVKSSMGVIVAVPTAGSCGACPGAIFATAHSLGKSEEDIVHAMLVSGLIGALITKHATFAAEVGGCMAECGSASGMAAAAIVTLAGGSLNQAIAASSIALQNSFGMTCDPVAGRVEAPCLGKNVMAATNALACANMALAGYNHLIPLDEVLVAMNSVGKMIPHELRCTLLGGLSTTPTSKAIEQSLAGQGKGSNPGYHPKFKTC